MGVFDENMAACFKCQSHSECLEIAKGGRGSVRCFRHGVVLDELEKWGKTSKCMDCYLRFDCDDETTYVCKSNGYCKYIANSGQSQKVKKRGNLGDFVFCNADNRNAVITICKNCEFVVKICDFDQAGKVVSAFMRGLGIKDAYVDVLGTGICIRDALHKELSSSRNVKYGFRLFESKAAELSRDIKMLCNAMSDIDISNG